MNINLNVDLPSEPDELGEKQVVCLSVRDDRRLRAYCKKKGFEVSPLLRHLIRQLLDAEKVR